MKIVLVAQDEPFFTPRLIDRVIRARGDVVAVVLPGAGGGRARSASSRQLWQVYGPIDFARLAWRYGLAVAASRLPTAMGLSRRWSAEKTARSFRISVLRPRSVNEDSFLATLQALDVDLVVSLASPQIFGQRLLQLPRFGCINVHGAPLPRYRGMFPSFWMLLHGEPQGAVTVHFMTREIDAGEILVQRWFPIDADDSLHGLIERSKGVAVEALLEALALIESGRAVPQPNDAGQATYFSFPTAKDASRLRATGRRLL